MDWYLDSKACLQVSEQLLQEIEELQLQAMLDNTKIPYLKVKIKNCLENCRSPLDYVANYIFDTYCRSRYTAHELRRFNVYFPIRYTKSLFDVCIRDNFRGLRNQAIIDIFEKYQPFPSNDAWLGDLTKLINENKHRKLTEQQILDKSEIHKGRIGSNNYSGLTFEGNGTDMMVNGKPFNGAEMLQVFQDVSATFIRKYNFEAINKDVTDTLKAIIAGCTQCIEDLHQVINQP